MRATDIRRFLLYYSTFLDMYVLDPRSRGATKTYHLKPRTLPAQGKDEQRKAPESRKNEQRTAPEWPRLPLTRESRATND
jgi:hypothetical protein